MRHFQLICMSVCTFTTPSRFILKFSPEDFIQQIIGSNKLHVVDIGAREGFEALSGLRGVIEILAVEPEAKAADELRKFYEKMNFSGYHIVRQAIGSRTGEGILNITKRPCMSSMLEPDIDGFHRHMRRVKYGPHWSEFLHVTDKQNVTLCTLPDLLKQYNWDKVDFLKIDTQGTELEILKSCEELLSKGSVNVVELEVAFIPIYKQQAYFSDIDQFMRKFGYHMVDLRTYPEFVQKLRSVHFGSEVYEPVKYNVAGDAIYVRDSFGTDRTQALRSALILASAGLFSEADYIIGDELSHSEKSDLFRYLTDQSFGTKIKSAFKRLLPPALLYAWFRMKSK